MLFSFVGLSTEFSSVVPNQGSMDPWLGTTALGVRINGGGWNKRGGSRNLLVT